MEKHGRIGSAIIFCITRPFAALPLGFHRKMGSFLGWFAGSVLRYRRDVVMTNISRSFPELKYDALKDIRRKFYRHFGIILGEAIWFGGCYNAERRLRKSGIGEFVNPEIVNRYKDEGRGVMVLFSHYGNWELLSGILQTHYSDKSLHYDIRDVCVTYRTQSSKAWDRFMHWNRLVPVNPKNGEQLIDTFNIIRYALRHRGDTKFYVFISDQHPYSGSSSAHLEKEFLHQDTCAINGAILLAKKLDLPIVNLHMTVREDGNYSLKFSPICDNAAGAEADDVLAEYYRLLEEDIKAQPWNYLWTHKRWK